MYAASRWPAAGMAMFTSGGGVNTFAMEVHIQAAGDTGALAYAYMDIVRVA